MLAVARVCGWLALGVLVSASGIQLEIGVRDIEEALKLARASEAERGRFHAAYQVAVTGPSVEGLEIITEYRRMVLLAEERTVLGQWSWLTREAEEALKPWKRKVAIRARVRFSPLKVYPRSPAIAIVVGQAPDALRPLSVRNDPQYGLAAPAQSGPLVGATVEAVFDAAAIGQRTLSVTIRGPEPAEFLSSVGFGRLR